uniref:Uncharacterized protein n=1 Tax=Panagrolaimus davidi TaxID=227884 RepID=A0A914QQB3_9BILA
MGSSYYNRRREQYVRNIRVRNIKYTTNTVLTVAEKSAYLNYAHKIEEYAKNDSAKREEAFTKFKLTTRKDEPLRNKRVEDLLTALRDLCDPPDGRIVKRENARYNHALPVNTDIEIEKKNDRTFIRLDDFSKTRSIYVDGIFLKDIYSKWFEATNLNALHLINVSPFETSGSWKRFENGIQKCSKLEHLSLSYCNIKDISDEIFKALPTSIINLDLSGNDLTRISPLITRLSNLEIIVFSNNKNLGDDGFPWDGIPETCTMMYLDNVKLTKVPHTIRRLIKLEILQISGPWK